MGGGGWREGGDGFWWGGCHWGCGFWGAFFGAGFAEGAACLHVLRAVFAVTGGGVDQDFFGVVLEVFFEEGHLKGGCVELCEELVVVGDVGLEGLNAIVVVGDGDAIAEV